MIKRCTRRTVRVARARRELQQHPLVRHRVTFTQAKAYVELRGARPMSYRLWGEQLPALTRTRGRRWALAFEVSNPWGVVCLAPVVLEKGNWFDRM